MAEAAIPELSELRTPGVGLRARELWARRETVRYLVTSDLESGNRDKVLGKLWSLLDPLLLLGVYFLVFGLGFRLADRASPGDFIGYLFIGIVVLRYIDASVSQSTVCLRRNRGIIHEIYFPKSVFPVSICLARLYDFLWGFLVLVAILVLGPTALTPHLLWVLPLLAAQLLLALGLSFFVAYGGAFFADATNLVKISVRLLLYFSPVFYYVRGEQSLIQNETLLGLYMLNPVACLFECYRDALLWGRAPEPAYLLYALGFGVAVCVGGFALFCRGEGVFAKHV